MATSSATSPTPTPSFRRRLQHKHHLSLQTHNIPPSPWPGGTPNTANPGVSSSSGSASTASTILMSGITSGSMSASAISPMRRQQQLFLQHSHSQQPQQQKEQYPASATATTRPPLSPRGYSAAAATGQSRFVEGSMNDRVSAAPPAGFLGADDLVDSDDESGEDRDKQQQVEMDEEEEQIREYRGWGGLDERLGGGGLTGVWGKGKGQGEYTTVAAGAERGSGSGLRTRGGALGGGGGRGGGVVGTASGRYVLRRPRSTAGWIRSGEQQQAGQGQGQSQGQNQGQRGGVVKKTSFLAPLWDGMREKLNLSKSKSSGSIGRVMSSVVGGGATGTVGTAAGENKKLDRDNETEKERLLMLAAQTGGAAPAPSAHPHPSATGYPSREEVLESYKSLVASGFFQAHAIRGGRHPLPARGGSSVAAAGPSGRSAFAEFNPPIPESPPSSTRKSFSERMVVSPPGSNVPSVSGRSFADHMAAQQQSQQQLKPAMSISSSSVHSRHTTNSNSDFNGHMPPPAPPPRGSSHGKSNSIGSPSSTLSSPSRGTKRGASVDLAGDAEMVTRKLVKKLRHSASRLSVELSGARDANGSSSKPIRRGSKDRNGNRIKSRSGNGKGYYPPLSSSSAKYGAVQQRPATAAGSSPSQGRGHGYSHSYDYGLASPTGGSSGIFGAAHLAAATPARHSVDVARPTAATTATSTATATAIVTASKGKLTKARDGRRRRILGLTRRHRSPEDDDQGEEQVREQPQQPPVQNTVNAQDEDVMMLDDPTPAPASSFSNNKLHRNITPPPASFRSPFAAHPHTKPNLTSATNTNSRNSSFRGGMRAVSNSSAMSIDCEDNGPQRNQGQEYSSGEYRYGYGSGSGSGSGFNGQREEGGGEKPLSIVPDPNQGIPSVPRIPREFCEGGGVVVPAAATSTTGGSFGGFAGFGGFGGAGASGVSVGVGGHGRGERKTAGNRDSGLGQGEGGENVENVPVWG
ncbi:uncharacterized protein C8A04DRAFT_25731 [Dichotomopilus funicola]|uniref:Uncharacterized protein n=1 Tax=Dichotomopilus funicola TaxID=1934379 RepID=A0AAN6V826_9PEZI|nr:hypothetical protein C8A04DRAFT_25731 [Dichotomopilus funicola]